jgi:hypothetical protein
MKITFQNLFRECSDLLYMANNEEIYIVEKRIHEKKVLKKKTRGFTLFFSFSLYMCKVRNEIYEFMNEFEIVI